MYHAPIVDCHTHTIYSDGRATFEDNVRAAAAAGCRVMISTDHLTVPASMDPSCTVCVAQTDLPNHRAAFERAQNLAAKIASGMEYIYGFECDWYEGCEPLVERWSQGATFRLGSVHWLGDPGDIPAGAGDTCTREVAPAGQHGSGCGWLDDYLDQHLWDELGPDEGWRRYVDTWCRACESPLDFDLMTHPDLACRFINEGYVPTIDRGPLYRQMAACAHDCGRRIEISTAGLRKSVRDYYPTGKLLDCFHRAEMPITFSSDAHRAEDICWGIRDAQRYAFDHAYRTFDVPHADGSWETVELA